MDKTIIHYDEMPPNQEGALHTVIAKETDSESAQWINDRIIPVGEAWIYNTNDVRVISWYEHV